MEAVNSHAKSQTSDDVGVAIHTREGFVATSAQCCGQTRSISMRRSATACAASRRSREAADAGS